MHAAAAGLPRQVLEHLVTRPCTACVCAVYCIGDNINRRSYSVHVTSHKNSRDAQAQSQRMACRRQANDAKIFQRESTVEQGRLMSRKKLHANNVQLLWRFELRFGWKVNGLTERIKIHL